MSHFCDSFVGPLSTFWVLYLGLNGNIGTNGNLVCTSNGGGAFVSMADPLDTSQSWILWFTPKLTAGGGDKFFHVINNPNPQPTDLTTWSNQSLIRIESAIVGSRSLNVSYWDTGGIQRWWNESTQAWNSVIKNSSGSYNYGGMVYCAFENDGPNQRWRIILFNNSPSNDANLGMRESGRTKWVNWANTRYGPTKHLILGQPYIDSTIQGNMEFGEVNLNIGPKVWTLTNGRKDGSFPYRIYNHYSFGSHNDALVFLRQESDSVSAINLGLAGTWDSNFTKDKSMVWHNGLYYCIYSAQGPNGMKLGMASCIDPSFGWIKHTSNPVVDMPGSSLYAPYLVCDPLNLTEKWRLLCAVMTNGIQDGIHMFSHDGANPDSKPWVYRGKILGLGTGWDGTAVSNPVLIYKDSQWQLWYASLDGVNWHIGRATGPDLFNLQRELVPRIGNQTRFRSTFSVISPNKILVSNGGFGIDTFVTLDDDSVAGKFVRTKVVAKNGNEVELLDNITGYTSGMIGEAGSGSTTIHAIIPVLGGYKFYVTPFGTMRGSSYGAFDENTGVIWAPTLEGPYYWLDYISPVTFHGKNNTKHSTENLAFPNQLLGY